ncbi:UV DNA damage repair endonuclease UvsE [Risungbinella massiliensis]|uniref:UV DNA damage repair endonuclease UvsE n=1 Tax=Risungbinella massiliensis TaxID=1329796 RepID=UPI0005CB8A3C|nr:UV DNA damage repair endonuclease UvsE [Risungbinella massiliensis]
MIVRFGFVAMSLYVKNASVSKTMTLKSFKAISDPNAARKKIYRIGLENLQNTKRILYHAIGSGIQFYRFSSRLVPLAGHDVVKGINYIKMLQKEFAEIGEVVRQNEMRVGFHPDHFTVLSSPKPEVIRYSAGDLARHVRMLQYMGLDSSYKCNIHVGGTYGDKEKAGARFIENFRRLDPKIQAHICLENDDKTFTAKETLAIAKEVGVPMVLDLHHHRCNNEGESLVEIFQEAVSTWKKEKFPPKIHLSSPKGETNIRSHADFVNPDDIVPFLQIAKQQIDRLDVMIEAKKKDEALFQLMLELEKLPGIERVSESSLKLV